MAGRLVRTRRQAEALREVYRDNVEAVYAFFAYSVGPDTAEDLTAATFERVVRSWSRFDPERARARTWILAIARNVLHRPLPSPVAPQRGLARRASALAASLVSSDDPAARYLSADTVREWLRGLEPRERELLALRFAADLPASEIARILDLTEDNVHQIASRALRRLHAQLSRSELTGSA